MELMKHYNFMQCSLEAYSMDTNDDVKLDGYNGLQNRIMVRFNVGRYS